MTQPGRLVFFYGPMGAGKSTLALQTHFNQSQQGRVGILLTKHDRSGMALVTSRIGLEAEAVMIDDHTDVHRVATEARHGAGLDYLVCDEAQFLTPTQVDELVRVADSDGVDVFTYGLLTDFRSVLFPGAARLVEVADEMHRIQTVVLCWCGRTAFLNARIVDDRMVREGDLVAIGDTTAGAISYRALCRRHYFEGRAAR
ncbi:thymidine kinase [Gordonia sp. NPDC003429]